MKTRSPKHGKGEVGGSSVWRYRCGDGRDAGFSLIELLLVLVIFSVLTAGVLQLCVQAQRSLQAGQSSSGLLDSGLRSIRQMSREISLAGFPDAGSFSATAVASYPGIVANSFVSVSPYDIVFEADVDGDGWVERIEYSLPAGSRTLVRQLTVKNRDGTLPVGSTLSQPFLNHVQNQILGQPLFTWDTDPADTRPFPQNVRTVYINTILRTTTSGTNDSVNQTLSAACPRMNP